MSRHKSMTKSDWKKKDKANRERKALFAALQAEKAAQEEKPDTIDNNETMSEV